MAGLQLPAATFSMARWFWHVSVDQPTGVGPGFSIFGNRS